MSEQRILMPYLFKDKSVRVFEYGGEIWFVACDVGKALGMGNIREQIRRALTPSECMHVKKVYDEKGRFWSVIVPKWDKFNSKSVRNSDTLKLGRTILAAINESGLYTLIMRSSKPEALKFRQWVTSEVLPSLRKTGSYTMPKTEEPAEPEYISTPEIETPKITVKIKISGRWPEVAGILSRLGQ